VPLLIIFAILFTNSHIPETAPASSFSLHTPLSNPLFLALLVIIPAWFGMRVSAGLWQYDPAQAQATLTELQRRVDENPGETLFIAQRQLVSMHMLKGVTLIPQYEREDLMELAMSRNTIALEAGFYARFCRRTALP